MHKTTVLDPYPGIDFERFKSLATVGRKLILGNCAGVEFTVFVVLLRNGCFVTFTMNDFLNGLLIYLEIICLYCYVFFVSSIFSVHNGS